MLKNVKKYLKSSLVFFCLSKLASHCSLDLLKILNPRLTETNFPNWSEFNLDSLGDNLEAKFSRNFGEDLFQIASILLEPCFEQAKFTKYSFSILSRLSRLFSPIDGLKRNKVVFSSNFPNWIWMIGQRLWLFLLMAWFLWVSL